MNILIVDDEKNALLSLARLIPLKHKDVVITEASSGQEAIDYLNKQSFDAVISDQRMGDISGIDVLKHAYEKQPDARRVLLTGYTGEPGIRNAIESDIIEYLLEKGCSKETILHALDDLWVRWS
ncbi:response regulator [Piscirickettsia litoralis]|uniref:Response regulatory domain-containing protein n=1 Tax=Piscirickettsia litoralis TaxID=1891921 RepID=A0ABX3A6Z2_9GAMM|nr:response regulator [Piscirickettsia litoralis]ODN41879.1 hypothetical protein BGC07_01485 [Piscirickettsia litoralis]